MENVETKKKKDLEDTCFKNIMKIGILSEAFKKIKQKKGRKNGR